MSKLEQLIAELCPHGVEYKALGEVCILKAGKSIKTECISSKRSEEMAYPCFGGNGLRGYHSTAMKEVSHLLADKVRYLVIFVLRLVNFTLPNTL